MKKKIAEAGLKLRLINWLLESFPLLYDGRAKIAHAEIDAEDLIEKLKKWGVIK